MEKSQCFDKDNMNILRGELYCFLDFIYAKDFNIKSIPRPLFFVPCTESGEIVCEKRELAQGELAVIVEATNLLWDFREIDFENVNKLTVPTYNYTTENGAQVLILDENFYNFLNSKGLVD